MIIYYTDKFTGSREESRRLFEKALAVHTGDEKKAKKLTGALKKGEHGKPYIEGFSCFSISHTGSIWAVLVAECECGLDIQLRRKCNIRAIAERWFAPEDAAEIISEEDFFRVWARREALAKALGGTVYDADLPEVLTGSTDIDGRRYIIIDTQLPEMPEIHAAVCVSDVECTAELNFTRL